MDIEDSEEFKSILKKYVEAKRQGRQMYLDSDDFVDIAEHYLRYDELDFTLETINDGLAIHKGDPMLLSLKANALISMHRFDEAKVIMAQLDETQDHDVYYFKGQMACGVDGDYATANRWFVKWYKREKAECKEMKDREEADLRLREAFLHIILSIQDLGPEAGKQKNILDWTNKYVEVCKPFAGDDVDKDIARACHEAGLFDLEIQLYTDFLDVNPYMPMGWTYLASLQNYIGDLDSSIESADFALAIDPDDSQALLVRGQSFYEKGNYEQALKSFSKYIDLTDDPAFYIVTGHCMVMQGQKEEGYEMLVKGREFITKEIKDKQHQKESRKFLLNCFFEGGFYTDARRMLSLLLRNDPNDFMLLCFRGRLNLKADKFKAAIKDFDYAAENSDNTVSALMLAGGCLVESSYYDDALRYFKKAVMIEDDPSHIKAWAYMAQMYFMVGETSKFFYCLRNACDMTPDLVKTIWSTELAGVAEDDYFDTLYKMYRNI